MSAFFVLFFFFPAQQSLPLLFPPFSCSNWHIFVPDSFKQQGEGYIFFMVQKLSQDLCLSLNVCKTKTPKKKQFFKTCRVSETDDLAECESSFPGDSLKSHQ